MKVFRTPLLRNLKTGFGIVAREFERASAGLHDDVTVVLANHGPWTKQNIVWLFWETGKPPVSWTAKLADLRHIWTPTRFCQEAFARSGIRSEVMPLGINPAYFQIRDTDSLTRSRLYRYKHVHLERSRTEYSVCRVIPQIAHKQTPQSWFRFLYPFDWIERKGPDIALRAFAEEFSSKDDIELVFCKFGLCTWTPNRLLSPVELMQQIAKIKPDLPRIVMLTNFPRYPRISELYRLSDCLVAPFRGQGVSMPVMEAMACGIPVITTNFGGTPETITSDLGWLIKVKDVVPVRMLDHFVPYQGEDLGTYAEPDLHHLKKCMREAFEYADQTRKKGIKASEFIRCNFTWSKSVARACKYVEDNWKCSR